MPPRTRSSFPRKPKERRTARCPAPCRPTAGSPALDELLASVDHIEEDVAAKAASSRPSYLYYVIAIGFVLPFFAVGLYLAIALSLAVPARTIRRLARAR